MSRYEEAFEGLATRGTPIGATALLEQVEVDLSGSIKMKGGSAGHRLPGFAVAGVAFLVTLAVGLFWSFFIAPGIDSADEPTDQGIEWIRLDSDRGALESVAAGPGGFIRIGFIVAPGASNLEFSTNGRTWTEVELEGLGVRSDFPTVATTNDSWLVMLHGETGVDAWVSSDGTDWTKVAWPADLDETVSHVVGSGGGYLAVSRDPFGAGTTLWWSPDGTRWSQLDDTTPGDPGQATLRGTSRGVVWLPFEPDKGSTASIYHSVDGTTWIEGSIELPAELSQSPVRWGLSIIDYVGGRWIALAEVSRTAADPIVHVWTSQDGIEWTSNGTPEFGHVEGRAVGIYQYAVIADLLVIAPTLIPVSEAPDGIVVASGAHTSAGELWATADGESWTRVLDTGTEIASLAGRSIDQQATVGIWVAIPETNNPQPVVTTAPAVSPQELDPTGLELQEAILADGTVTREEFEQALEGWKTCMESRGVTDVTFEINRQGGWSTEYASPTPNAGQAEDAACIHSYVNQVADALSR